MYIFLCYVLGTSTCLCLLKTAALDMDKPLCCVYHMNESNPLKCNLSSFIMIGQLRL